MTRITKTNFKEAIIKTGGNQSVIAKRLGVGRSAISMFLKKNPEMGDFLNEEKEMIVDLAENQLLQALNRGEKWAVLRVLDTLGRKRGYSKDGPIEEIKDNKLEVKVVQVNINTEEELEEFRRERNIH